MSEPIFEKKCTGPCGLVLSLDSFHRDASRKDGRAGICKECRKPAQKAYAKKNATAARARAKAWNKANPERALTKAVQWAKDHPERIREIKRNWKKKTGYDTSKHAQKLSRERRARQRREAVEIMGNECSCCGCKIFEFICFDHHGGWGVEHRRIVNTVGMPLWLKKHNYPKGDGTTCECGEIHQGVRLLCFDCNMSSSFSPDGTCAHEESPEETRRKRIDPGTTEKQRCEREWRIKLREEIFREYGSECYCCHQTDERFLCIDHPGNWGRDHRLEIASGGPLLSWIRNHHFPKGKKICPECGVRHKAVRLACFNCNMAAGKSEDGQCPHIHEAAIAA